MLSRAGHVQMRTALYMPALVASRHNPVVKAFGDRLRTAGLAPKAVVGACMHKLAMLIYGVLRSGVPFDPRIARLSLTSKTVSESGFLSARPDAHILVSRDRHICLIVISEQPECLHWHCYQSNI